MGIERVTVFGGTGFVGRRIVKRLSSDGTSVRVAVRHPATDLADQAGSATGAVTHVFADIRDEASVTTAIEGSQAVINAVSLFVERGNITFDAVHVRGGQNVAREAKRLGVECLVYLSGLGADPESPSSYVRARASGESVVQSAFPNATVLRPSVIFGAGDSFFSALSDISRFSPVFPLFGNGDTRLQPVFVEDVAAAAVRALVEPGAKGKIYELGGAQVYSYKALVELLLKHLGRKRLIVPMPFVAWQFQAALLGLLPNPPLTRDQVILMQHDNIVSKGARTLADLGIEPAAVEAQLAGCFGDKG